uniref:Bm14111, isoform b n=1 Tax=Brugia malayi TaxID=6279 RepID=A0A1I9GBG2_BRUMA|nr:Bm14111, isoform b [Brugia malayi]
MSGKAVRSRHLLFVFTSYYVSSYGKAVRSRHLLFVFTSYYVSSYGKAVRKLKAMKFAEMLIYFIMV